MADFNIDNHPEKRKRSSGSRGSSRGPSRGPSRKRLRSNGSRRRDSGPRNSEERAQHKVVCDACGETCEVPFKPTEGKPVYCDTCFRTNKNQPSRPRNSISPKDLDQINEKLDKILTALKVE